ncbi:M13 family metallopeptidase [Niveibacterium umoris]|uniref:Endothelin-converting enzyme/putative endopeptidase n=1 Tax=Niveibacterium umoris TaxID=1193620 RepID=A0A840BI19_9RHOO|nr:M13 family metallopeptidase [Niveibacterium umoris]MBB4012630.1 endothelin-converting enzyme/putative endopeptidase [Niveibacterium umoris]
MQTLAARSVAALMALTVVFVSAHAADPASQTPLDAMPYTPSLDVSAMDRDANPCEDLYQYACGNWIKNNPIPADQSHWSVYSKLAADGQRFQWGILQRLADAKNGNTPLQQKLGNYFAACMDEAHVEASGATPMAPVLKRIDALQSHRELPALLAELHQDLPGASPFFGFFAAQDFADADRVIAFAAAGGLGLPDRDNYLKTDERNRALRKQYIEHIARMFVLLGDDVAQAERNAADVMRIETALARASLSRVDLRDPIKQHHPMDARQLQALTPHFDWSGYLAGVQLRELEQFNVTEPKFYRRLDALLTQEPLEAQKTYLRWHAARAFAPHLSKVFVDESFAFYGKTLLGTPEQKPRWKRCVMLADQQLGEALGQEFVSRAFSAELKAQTQRMTQQIEEAMAKDIDSLPWMSKETKARAQEKLRAIVNKIGYPDKWRNYDAFVVSRGDYAGNVVRGSRFEAQRQFAKIGKPLDRGEWDMTPSTVNAYYNPQMNDINFPAAVLQPPLYDPKLDDAPNYGNTGGTIGHELTHAFDDEGRHFDGQGRLRDWWSRRDAKAFEERAQCIVDQYAKYVVVDDIKINSRLTLGEDIADLGGMILAWSAWKAEVAGKALESRDGLTPDQRFFVGFAQWACEATRPEELRIHAMTDPHSPGKYRINGVAANMPEFQQAFACKAGQAMVKARRCRVW